MTATSSKGNVNNPWIYSCYEVLLMLSLGGWLLWSLQCLCLSRGGLFLWRSVARLLLLWGCLVRRISSYVRGSGRFAIVRFWFSYNTWWCNDVPYLTPL